MSALTYNDMLGAYSHYPAPIRPYLLRAETHPTLRSMLTKSFMRVVVDVLSRAPIADPVRPIKLRVDIVADDLDVSTKTVSRALNILRKNGWLRRSSDHDGRNNWGEFCSGEFILGDGLRAMLGLPTITTQHQAQHASDAVMSANEGSACHSSQAATSAGFTPSPVLAAPVPGYAASTDDAAVPDWAKAKAEAGPTKTDQENQTMKTTFKDDSHKTPPN